MWIIFALNILLIIAILLPSRISFLYIPSNPSPITISYLIFEYTPRKKGGVKIPRAPLIKLLYYILSRSRVEANDGFSPSDSLSNFASVISLPLLLGKYALLSLLSANAKSFRLINDFNHPFYIKLSFSLLTLFISSIKLLYYILKNKFKRIANEYQ